MSSLVRRDPKTVLPDLTDWFEAPFMTLRPFLVRPATADEDDITASYRDGILEVARCCSLTAGMPDGTWRSG
jgi:hypothetical protein